jgi:PAS domain S-box-containing protein
MARMLSASPRQGSLRRKALPGAAGAALALEVNLPFSPPVLATALGGLLLLVLLGVGAIVLHRRGRGTDPPPPPGAEARLEELTELAGALDMATVLVRSPEGVIRHWSAGCERLFGFTAEEAVGRQAHELLRTRFPDGGRREAQATLLREGEWHGELRHRRRDGRAITVAAHWALRRDPVTGEAGSVVEASTDATELKAAEAALRAGEARLRLAQEVAGVASWEWDHETQTMEWSPEQHALFGTDPAVMGDRVTLGAFLQLVHPEDRATVEAAIHDSLETGSYEAEFRVARPGRDGAEEPRWLIGRGRMLPGLEGRRGAMLGVNVDITARKEAETRQALLMREVDHRAKNALAVVQAVLRLTRAGDQTSYARAVEGRVAALARAHTLLTEARWAGAELRALLAGELTPFLAPGAEAPGDAPPRALLEGPPVTVPPLTAQPLSMTIHELATNAVKYGALSMPGGRLRVIWSMQQEGRELLLHWVERGGPPIAGPPSRQGIGSRVIGNTIRDQLGGDVTLCWAAEGLECEIRLPLAPVARSQAAEPVS